ncbi:hypothetical protein SKAU_G00404270 [Synaphobranchus kaupii]|uniref:Ig-like domain-containing protein n=1 Tax=Synaphobranchus kaupii TaxID=118154 RepID=A0A9Q1E9M9_SYNKA|nr:hypothetical protein SKAU_G00404270 [Synaphobranchus kaupii]
MVDDVQVEYFDNKDNKVISRRHWKVEDVVEEPDLKTSVMFHVRDDLIVGFQLMKPRLNHTDGVHTYQRITGCEMNADAASPVLMWDAYDGIGTRSYNKVTNAYSPLFPEFMWSKLKYEAVQQLNINLYQPLCVRTLKSYLQQDKNTVMRKVRPRVRVIQKTHPDSGAQQMICLATGFYPRHINMTLLRDGQTVPEEHLITGELLPNGDGTYQQRKTLSLSAEERKERHDYTCTVTHMSLSNKLDITWVRPRVRVMLKTHPESGAQQVSCLATGFYPRHINMTLLRDGQTFPEERLITGELLPNGDGTYQQRKTLSLSVEERKERNSYTCTVTHTSLSNKLDITWEPGPAPDIIFIAVAVYVAVSVIVVLVLAVAAFIKWKRRSEGQQGHVQPVYTASPVKDDASS